MRTYLKILLSISLALVSLSACASLALMLGTVFGDGDYVADHIFLLPAIIALVGFMFFGLSGSLIWLVMQQALATTALRPLGRHAISVATGIAGSLLLFLITFAGSGGVSLSEFTGLLSFVTIAAAVSLLWYWALFIRRQVNKS